MFGSSGCTNLSGINTALSTAGGTSLVAAPANYWTSNESSASLAKAWGLWANGDAKPYESASKYSCWAYKY